MVDFTQPQAVIVNGISTALIAAVISIAVSKKSSYITAVTVERSKWIDKLRENIAALLGVCGAIHLTLEDTKSTEALTKRENADRLMALITMQLNPNNDIDKNMIKLLPVLIQEAQKKNGKYRSVEKKLVGHAQYLLKEEWEKVKTEAHGWLMSALLCTSSKDRERQKDYKNFLQLEQNK